MIEKMDIRKKPRDEEKLKVFCIMAKSAVTEGVIFEGKKIIEILPWIEEKLEFFGKLGSQFPDNKKPVLVGGSAVELYTRGIAKSIDMDIIADREVIAPVLLKQEFKQEGRHFYKGRIYIEIPSDSLDGRAIIIKYMGYKIRIISVEDLIIDRLSACKFWESVYDCEQAEMLLYAYKDKVDMEYIDKKAKEKALIL